MIRNHRALGLHVHLLVRPTKKTGSQPTPFTYCGEVDFADWEGEAPIHRSLEASGCSTGFVALAARRSPI